MKIVLRLVAAASIFVSLFASAVDAGEITDIYGRRLSLPDRPRKVFSTSPTVTYLLYAIDPGMLAGLNFPVRGKQRKYLSKGAARLPVIGWFGQGQSLNREVLLAANPDIIFTSTLDQAFNNKAMETLKGMRTPVFDMTLDRLSDYPDALLRAGRILRREKRARKLSDYCSRTLTEAAAFVARLPTEKRVSVYYAEGTDGLSTECDTSRHAELIRLAGGVNVHKCLARNPYGLEKISLEQVLVYNPDVILAFDRGFYQKVSRDPIWRTIKAVKTGRVYLIPDEPINWFDRPPSFMRFLGLKWVLNRLYPHEYRIDMIREAREFYSLFLKVEVSEKDMKGIIGR